MEQNGVASRVASVLKLVNSLSDREKEELIAELLGSDVRRSNNIVTPKAVFQLSGSAEEMSKNLEQVPPEIIGEFLKAVGIYITRRNFALRAPGQSSNLAGKSLLQNLKNK